MKTVLLDVRSPEQAVAEMGAALRAGKACKNARISFVTPALLWKVLTPALEQVPDRQLPVPPFDFSKQPLDR